MKFTPIAVIFALVVPLTACAPPPKVKRVVIVSNNYCKIAGKVSWVLTDAPTTIDDARRENAKIDRNCKKKKN